MAQDNILLPFEKLSNWIHSICIVTFDLELGQVIELIYPPNAKLSEKERANICYLAFPDSNSGVMGDTRFHFRIRQQIRRPDCPNQQFYNHLCSVPLQMSNTHLYGYAYFRQKKDKTIPRGYFQKSVVLLTHLPLTALFLHIVTVISPSSFTSGLPVFEVAAHDIEQWPAPHPGQNQQLPFLGTVIQIRIPSRIDRFPNSDILKRKVNPLNAETHLILPSTHELDIFRSLSNFLPTVQMLWELILTCEPLVVMASSPAVCSEVVHSLVLLIWPLLHNSDYRPYFTIHDTEFKQYTTRSQSPPNLILGVTNPFFSKTLQHWPHIIKVSDAEKSMRRNTKKSGLNTKLLDMKPGVFTKYKPFLVKDKDLLAYIGKGLENGRSVEEQSAIIRRFFNELTQTFMIPLGERS